MWKDMGETLRYLAFGQADGGKVWIRMDVIEAFGTTWVQVMSGQRYEGLCDVPGVMGRGY
jgi:hypothetical protein